MKILSKIICYFKGHTFKLAIHPIKIKIATPKVMLATAILDFPEYTLVETPYINEGVRQVWECDRCGKLEITERFLEDKYNDY